MRKTPTYRAFRAAEPGKDKPLQSIHPTLEQARAWAKKVQVDGLPFAPVEIYEISEKLVETVTNDLGSPKDGSIARLIAAAPDLLAALKDFRCGDCKDGILLHDSPLFDLDREGEEQPCPNCAKIRAAIAKAEGQQ